MKSIAKQLTTDVPTTTWLHIHQAVADYLPDARLVTDDFGSPLSLAINAELRQQTGVAEPVTPPFLSEPVPGLWD